MKKVKISLLILVWSIVVIQICVNCQDKYKLKMLKERNSVTTSFVTDEDVHFEKSKNIKNNYKYPIVCP